MNGEPQGDRRPNQIPHGGIRIGMENQEGYNLFDFPHAAFWSHFIAD